MVIQRVSSFLLLLAACSSAPAAPTAQPVQAPEAASLEREQAAEAMPENSQVTPDAAAANATSTLGSGEEGSPCLDSSECASGICEGQGCSDDAPGVCVAGGRLCTRDYVPYCGCDGTTFRGSGNCPGRRYAHEGACEGAPEQE